MSESRDKEITSLLIEATKCLTTEDLELVHKKIRRLAAKATYFSIALPIDKKNEIDLAADRIKQIAAVLKVIGTEKDDRISLLQAVYGEELEGNELIAKLVINDSEHPTLKARLQYILEYLSKNILELNTEVAALCEDSVHLPRFPDLVEQVTAYKSWLRAQADLSLGEVILGDGESEITPAALWKILRTDPNLQDTDYYINDYEGGSNYDFSKLCRAFWSTNEFNCSIDQDGLVHLVSEYGLVKLPWANFVRLFLSPARMFEFWWGQPHHSYLGVLCEETNGTVLRHIKAVDKAVGTAFKNQIQLLHFSPVKWANDGLMDFLPCRDEVIWLDDLGEEFFDFPNLKSIQATAEIQKFLTDGNSHLFSPIETIALLDPEESWNEFEDHRFLLFQKTIRELHAGGHFTLVELCCMLRLTFWLPLERGNHLDWKSFLQWVAGALINPSIKSYLGLFTRLVITKDSDLWPFANAFYESTRDAHDWLKHIQLEAENLSTDFMKDFSCNEFTRQEIDQHFRLVALANSRFASPANLLIPLFRAAEQEMKLFIEATTGERLENTNYEHLLNRMKQILSQRELHDEVRKIWNKTKRRAFKVAGIRNQCAHASLVDASAIPVVQQAVADILLVTTFLQSRDCPI